MYVTNGSYGFEVVDAVPAGYSIWNIPLDGMKENYLPLAKLRPIQPFEGCTEVDVTALKAIKVKGGVKEMIRAKALAGIGTIYKAACFMNKYFEENGSVKHADMPWEVAIVDTALSYMKQFSWN